MGEKYWTGVRPQHGRVLLVAVPLIVTMAVGLIIGMRVAGHGDPTLRLTSRGSGTPTSAAPQSSVPATAPATALATVPATATPAGGAGAPSAAPPSPAALPTATATVLP